MGCGAACGGGCCSARDARDLHAVRVLGDPFAARAYAARHGLAVPPRPVGQSMGKLLPTFVDRDAVRAQKRRIDPLVSTLAADVQACASKVDPRELTSWNLWVASWGAFRDTPEGWWTVTSEYDEALRFERDLEGWQAKFEGRCTLSNPKIDTSDKDGDNVASIVKWGALAVVTVGVVYLAAPWVSSLSSKRKRSAA